jgi:hypothetical protein
VFWACLLSVFIYWVYYLWSEAETHEVYDKKFEENKWTCWGCYSMHYLANTQFFSVLTRESLMFFNYSFQAMILSALYSTLGEKVPPYTHFEIIVWAAAIAFGASLPVPYILGGVFLQKIYTASLEKFKIVRKTKGLLNKKEENSTYEGEIDKLEERLYSLYFFYYIIIFAGFMCFWIPAIYMMMQTHRDWFYLHRLWYTLSYSGSPRSASPLCWITSSSTRSSAGSWETPNSIACEATSTTSNSGRSTRKSRNDAPPHFIFDEIFSIYSLSLFIIVCLTLLLIGKQKQHM